VAEVTGQRGDQHVDDVGQPVLPRPVVAGSRIAAPCERGVHGGEQRVDALVLLLHRVEHRQGVLAVRQARAQRRPDDLVLGGVVQVQFALEQLPAGGDRPPLGGVGQVGRGGRARQPGQVAAEGVVRRDHDGQVGAPGAVPGRVGTRQFLSGHRLASVVGDGGRTLRR
jgi:hypothetical protein